MFLEKSKNARKMMSRNGKVKLVCLHSLFLFVYEFSENLSLSLSPHRSQVAQRPTLVVTDTAVRGSHTLAMSLTRQL